MRENVALAIIKHEGKVLMVRRKFKEGDLHWQFPGGYILEGESTLMAAARETKEESNVFCEPIRIIGERYHPSTNKHLSYVECSYKEGEAKINDEEEVDKVEWMTPSEVVDCITSDLFEPVRRFIFNSNKNNHELLPNKIG